jgi:hypothetical protein
MFDVQILIQEFIANFPRMYYTNLLCTNLLRIVSNYSRITLFAFYSSNSCLIRSKPISLELYRIFTNNLIRNSFVLFVIHSCLLIRGSFVIYLCLLVRDSFVFTRWLRRGLYHAPNAKIDFEIKVKNKARTS